MKEKVWTAKEVERILLLAQNIVSLNDTVPSTEGDDETEIGAFLEDTNPTPEELVLLEGTRNKLFEYMNKYLTPREILVLKLRFGFETGSVVTLEDVGKELGVVRERVRQIEQKALRKLRLVFMRKGLKKEDI